MWAHRDGDDLILRCHVQPGASRDGFAGEHAGRLKVRIAAPAVDGKANRHLQRFLARAFGIRPRAVQLLAGTRGRHKTLRLRAPRCCPPDLPSADCLAPLKGAD